MSHHLPIGGNVIQAGGSSSSSEGETKRLAILEKTITAVSICGIAFLLLPLIQWATRPLTAGDVFWQVRTGEIALTTGRAPDHDPFSYTIGGSLWNNHEWGFEVLAALIHRLWGWGG